MKQSISDILPYIVFDDVREENVPILEDSLEEIVLSEKISVTEEEVGLDADLFFEEKKEEKMHDKAVVRYDLFIPVASIGGYEQLQISYTSRKSSEVFEVEAVKEGKKEFFGLEKESAAEKEYMIQFTYDAERRGYRVSYESSTYKDKIEEARQDFRLALDKSLDIIPKSLMGGVLGFTYLGSGKIARRDDLFGDMAMLVDVHESIHTPDEYETRVLTDWILKIEAPKYKG